MSPAEFLYKHVLARAQLRGWRAVPNPDVLGHMDFRRPEGDPSATATPVEATTMAPCHCAIIGVYAIFVGYLGDAAESAEDLLLSHHRRAAWARSWLGVRMKENIYIFLAGPVGSGSPECTDWKDVAHTFERDERICRKLVWLPDADPSTWARGIDAFFDRTVLAQPWEVEGGVGELDPVGEILNHPEVPIAWRGVLQQSLDPEQSLAEVLLDCLEHEPKGGA